MTDRDRYNLTLFEKDCLRAAGMETSKPICWGAAMSVAIETLAYFGLMDKFGKITEKGRSYITTGLIT